MIDFFSVMIALGISAFLVATLALIYHILSEDKLSFFPLFFIGLFCQSFGLLGIAFRSYLDPLLTINLSNTIFLIGFLLQFLGIVAFDDKIGKLCSRSLILITVIGIVAFNLLSHSTISRTIVLSSALCLTVFISCICLLIKGKGHKTTKIIIGVYGIMALVFFCRIVILLMLESAHYRFVELGWADQLVLLALLIHLIVGTVSYILLLNEVSAKNIANANNLNRWALEQSPTSIVITDLDANIIHTNPMFSEVTGYSRQDVYARNPRILNSGLTSFQVFEDLWEHLKHGRLWQGEFSNRKKNGHTYFEKATIGPIHNADGEIANYIAIKEDITEKKRIDKLLKSSEQRLKTVFESTFSGMSIFDKKGYLVASNPISDQIRGYSGIDGDRRHYTKGIHPEDLSFSKEAFDSIICGRKRHVNGEIRVVHAETGEYIWSHVNISKYPDPEDSDNDGIIVVFQDITSLKNLEAELRTLIGTKDKFFSIVAHDLRGPIGSLLSVFELCIEDDEDEQAILNAPETRQQIYENLRNVYKLLENLLLWGRSQTGEISTQIKEISYTDTVWENIHLYAQIAKSKSIEIQFSPINEYILKSDEFVLNTVLRNLIGNAIKYTPENGQIRILIEEDRKSGRIKTTVRDNGIGIDDTRIDALFTAGENTSTPGTCNEKGTGLGLVLCRDLISKIGGSIDVKSEKGKGSDFCFIFPVESQ